MSQVDSIRLRIRRSAIGAPTSRYVTCKVPVQPETTVLDAVSWAQRERFHDLAYRYSCRVGMCGTCAMVVNGREGWTCRTLLAQLNTSVVTVEPLRNLPVIKDLVVDMRPFFAAMDRAMAYHVPRGEIREASPFDAPALMQRAAIDPHLECISCGACYSACTMLRWDPEYLGPAALNRVATLVRDPRDGARERRLDAVNDEHGCWRCHSQFTCNTVCPMHLNPSDSIADLKRLLVARAARNLVIGGVGSASERADCPPTDAAPRDLDETGRRTGTSAVGSAPHSALRSRRWWLGFTRPGVGAGLAGLAPDLLAKPILTAGLAALAVALIYLGGIEATSRQLDQDVLIPGDARDPIMLAGADVFEQRDCRRCHALLGFGGRTAPDLWRAGDRHSDAWLGTLLRNPDLVLSADSGMPAYTFLSEGDSSALVAYLGALDFARVPAVRVPRTIVRGGAAFVRHGCARCHEDGVAPGDLRDPAAIEAWLRSALASSSSHSESMASLPDQDVAHIAAYTTGLER